MNITKQQLKQIIQEELSILSEQPAPLDIDRLMGDLRAVMNSIHQFSKRVKHLREDIGQIHTSSGARYIDGAVMVAYSELQIVEGLLRKYFDNMPRGDKYFDDNMPRGDKQGRQP
jgi:hypothetical protein